MQAPRAAAPWDQEGAPRPREPRRCRRHSMGGSEPYQGAVCRQSPKRKVGAIAVISEVEHARKPRRGEARITPQTVVLLGSQQVFDTAPHRIGADLPGRQQPQQGPGTLVGSARRFSGCLLPVRVGVIALAPAAVGILPGYEPTHGAARSEEHTSELQSQSNLVCRLLLEKKEN